MFLSQQLKNMFKKEEKYVAAVLSMTTFLQNGTVLADPLDEENIQLPPEFYGKFNGTLEITPDGMVVFKRRSRVGTGASRYHTVFRTPYTKVKVTKRAAIVEHRFPIGLANKEKLKIYAAEHVLVKAFVAAQKNSKNW